MCAVEIVLKGGTNADCNSFAGADAILERDPRYTRDRAKFDGGTWPT